ncbi:uncharacterized protein LOC125494803 [Beta vulgaris subsp. vulgaris]|uniref:uncharacterized protein LOC125494803 n=1 Tax=Beta vulgaris subsp. vulgaris TaxID=3555 RepID=UPI002548AAE7|nr:uncharacterized protein LOC125494803 [Beta vulgaris subsp. vulgaris]
MVRMFHMYYLRRSTPYRPELFLKTHFKTVAGKGEIAANKRAKQISETYNKKLDDCSTQGSQPNPDLLYWETVGGRNRGKVQGLGQGDYLYYNSSSGRGGDGSSQPYEPSIISQLEAQVEAKVAARMVEVEAKVAARLEESNRALVCRK